MFSAAATVLDGATLLTVVAENRFPQGLESPAVPPVVLTQLESMLARVSTLAMGKVAPAGSAGPGAAPLAMLATLVTAANASPRPTWLVAVEPMLVAPVINGASAHTLATVVSSFTVT